MPDIKNVFASEIRRLAKKEVKAALQPMYTQLVGLRKTITEQKAKIKLLEKRTPAIPKPAKEIVPVSEDKAIRLTPERIIKLRQKLGLTQGQFAALLGSNNFSVSNWELGKATPRDAFKRKIAALRGLGKRELKRLLEEKSKTAETVVAPKAKKTPVKIASSTKSKIKPVPTVKKPTKAKVEAKSIAAKTSPVKPVKVPVAKSPKKKVAVVTPVAAAKPEAKSTPAKVKTATVKKTEVKPVKAVKAKSIPAVDVKPETETAKPVQPETIAPVKKEKAKPAKTVKKKSVAAPAPEKTEAPAASPVTSTESEPAKQ